MGIENPFLVRMALAHAALMTAQTDDERKAAKVELAKVQELDLMFKAFQSASLFRNGKVLFMQA